ncbi:hypothetical protein Acsp04_48660 [Actinomadura sp. NBRC 104425]|uniref:DUF2142 domain-containing protein n=1 Tax=Actinomadura sp. NBRC 104425 TaxID=3032204 RepID=UPI0024A5BBB0|nr:DUF2142 domain-containing protein [Actinomadura sp. NBRC 104425]GLZ14631.1 hypothetical protein Acsp04_48660 [Actinomadura sp. NBRC 104425]
MTPAPPSRLIAILAFLGFFAVGGGWAIAMPWDGGPDEQAHITRAAGVVGGDVAAPPAYITVPGFPRPLPGTHQTVPSGVLRKSPACFAFKPEQPASCMDERAPAPRPHAPAEGFSATGRYHPTYHAVVGWPLRLWPDDTGLLLARLLSAALSAAFLAAATHSVLAWARRPFLLAGLLVAATPLALHLTGVINPNGLEVSAAIAMWTALIPAVLDDRPVERRLLVLAGVAAAVVAWSRPSGPLAVALALAVLGGTAGRARLARLVRDRAARLTALAVAAACLTSGIWTLAMKATELVPVPGGAGLGPADALRVVAVERLSFYLKSMVGQFGWLDFTMPAAFYAVWFAAAGFLLLAALAAGTGRDRLRLLLTAAGAFALPLWLDVFGAESDGMVAQGRYMLPCAVGAVLLAAYTVDESGLFARPFAPSVTRWLAAAVLPAHLVGLAYTMIRYQHGLRPGVPAVNPLTGEWQPPLGSATALLTATVGLLALGAMTWLCTRAARFGNAGAPRDRYTPAAAS